MCDIKKQQVIYLDIISKTNYHYVAGYLTAKMSTRWLVISLLL